MNDKLFGTDGPSVPRIPGTTVHWFSTLLALCFLLLCVAIGMVGLILPIIPGFLFLMLAALLAARLFPALGRRLARNPWFRSHLQRTCQFAGLSMRGKAQLLCWITLRLLLDGFLWLVAALAWLMNQET